MLRALLNLLRRPAIRMGLARDRRRTLRNPGFVSFMLDNNRRRLGGNAHERALLWRRWLRGSALALLVIGIAWVAIESAKALSVF
ncbi:hypothetical protein [Cephaloticoccus capnophilus]|nr:hypothetical protein [Cephaloticoccus capnophilus]